MPDRRAADPTLPKPAAADSRGGTEPFWRRKALADMTAGEWESLCDGCGKCCLEKLECGRSGEISYTNVACQLLDLDTCRCRHYADRRRWVSNCEKLTPAKVRRLPWLPTTCAYRLRAQGRDLPGWHWLVSGDRELVHVVGASVRGRAVAAADAGPLDHHICIWPR
jgi:uncharacterized cysteine cluster protein YcgN (CxxCxxCC family)